MKPDIVVLMHAAHRARLEFNARDANFRPVDLPYRRDAWIGTGRLRARGQCAKQSEKQSSESGWASHGSPPNAAAGP
jgi:hypothetical protein